MTIKLGFLSLLALVFITLKLLKVIAWSWWIVTAPLWGGFIAALGLIVLIGIAGLFASRL